MLHQEVGEARRVVRLHRKAEMKLGKLGESKDFTRRLGKLGALKCFIMRLRMSWGSLGSQKALQRGWGRAGEGNLKATP